MPMAIFYEIVWLDLFPAGTYVPPNGSLSVFLLLCFVYVIGFHGDGAVPSPADILLPLLLAMPAAECSSRVESYLRHLNNTRYEALLSHTSSESQQSPQFLQSPQSPQKLIMASLAQAFFVHMASFILCFLVLFVTFWAVQACLGYFPQQFIHLNENLQQIVTWPMLWFGALLGSLLALRIKKAYMAYGATVLVLFMSFFA